MTAIWQKMHARPGESDIAQLQREVLTGQLVAFLKFKTDFLIIVLNFIKNMIFFSKLIDICINRYESQKVVDNYFVGTIDVSVRTNKQIDTKINQK